MQPGTKKGLVRNVFSLGLVQVANYVLPFVSLPIISRIIGPEKFGVINFAAAFVAYFTLLINFGFELTATRAIAANRNNLEERNRIFNQVLLAKMLLLGVSIILFIACLFLLPQFRNEQRVAVFSFIICFSWLITPNWLYQGMQELTRVAIFNLVTKVVFTVAILLMIRERSDYVWQPLALSLAQILVGVFSFTYAIRRYDITIALPPIGPVLHMLWNERMIFFSTVVINLYTTTNVVLLGLLQNETQVGYYTAGWRLITVIQSVITIPLSQSLFPFVGTAFAQGRDKGVQVVQQLFPVITILTGAAAVVLWLLGPLMISVLYGEAFDPSIAVFRILTFVPMVIGWSNLLGIQTMVNLKMDKVFFRITALGALSSILLNFLMVTRIGFIGTAWSWLLTEVLIAAAMYFVLSRQGISVLNWRYFTPAHFKRFLRPLIVTVKQKINR